MLTMQEALLALTRYWTEQGCMVVQPMNTEVGAGTLNPATALRVLGPEPWRVVYVEPSVRPDDARYGENPNRLQTHTQVQVILKPEPGNPQELYLGSLDAIGIDIRAHDVRFVEDNWASPALGAWGLGWEVWLDGLEITQFTYFQQSGGMTLDPVSVEITYGMERIIMALQRVSHFKDIAYAPGISYGEAFGQAEYEMSRYYLDDADIDANRTLFDTYAAEAQRLIDARLPVPAHSYVLKCSHAFNVLDSRGAISTTERARAFARMRALAHQVAALWTARREELGHPLGAVSPRSAPALDAALPEITEPATLAVEIGVEEMPPAETTRAADAVHGMLADKLAATRLAHGPIRVVSSPRRVVAIVEQVAPRESDHEQTARGPRASAAYDADGQPTKAARGFARGHGVDVADLQELDIDGAAYVGLVKHIPGRPAGQVLAAILPEVVAGLRAQKNMRWNAPGLSFTRPIRWILALLGDQVVPFTVSALTADRTTHVHRTADAPAIDVPNADGHLDILASHQVIADAVQRQRQILDGASVLAADLGGHLDLAGTPGLLEEITNLVEYPTPILGHFDPSYLELPQQILVTVMRKHQRYLPVRDADGTLLPAFVAVANGACDHEAVRAGNEAVLRARYEDAAFFYRHDLETPLARMKATLGSLTFENRLGSMAQRADRIAAIAARLADLAPLDDTDRVTLARAGELIKFDLGSQMVTELTSLAGTMAREYALHAGETPEVAEALFEAELPRAAADTPPRTVPGAILALADRFDLLAGLFALGSAPTGSSDPFGLRRAALGAVTILRAHPALAPITLPHGLALAAEQQLVPVDQAAQEAALEFTVRRFEQAMIDQHHPITLIRAVLPLATAPARAELTLTQLDALTSDDGFRQLTAAIQRVRRILPADTPTTYQPDLFDAAVEHTLHDAVDKLRGALPTGYDLAHFAAAATILTDPINGFFDDVLVMADDPAVRTNRLGLLATAYHLAAPVLAWDELND